MFGINDTVAKNAEAYAKIPAKYPPGWVEGHALAAAEGGFAKNDRVVIDNPDYSIHGMSGVCIEAATPRTVFVAVDGTTRRFCISSLRHA